MRTSLAAVTPSPKLGGETEEAQALRQVFAQVDEWSCPNSYNFHLHTQFSDGKLRPEEIMAQAIALGLKGLTITDHHSIGGYQAARHWLNHQSHSPQTLPQLWTGIEINADLLQTEVHILGYGFAPDHPTLQPYLQGKTVVGEAYQASQVIAAIHQAGGLAVLAHPARYRRSPTELIPEAVRWGIDGVETYYAYHNPKPWKPSSQQTEQVRQLGKLYNLFHTCGTDTHGGDIQTRL